MNLIELKMFIKHALQILTNLQKENIFMMIKILLKINLLLKIKK